MKTSPRQVGFPACDGVCLLVGSTGEDVNTSTNKGFLQFLLNSFIHHMLSSSASASASGYETVDDESREKAPRHPI